MDIYKIKQMFRIIFRNKTHSFLNIAGLAFGITCAALILLWVEDELTYNDFPEKEQLYAVYQNQDYGGEIITALTAPNPLAATLMEEVPGIINVMRYRSSGKNLFTLNGKMLYEAGAHTDSTIFSMLNIEFVMGNAADAFDAAYPVVITEEMANKFFGTDNPIGQTLKKDNGQEYEVTAVVKNPKRNSDFTFSWLIPFRELIKERIANGWQIAETTWEGNWIRNYVKLEASADVNQVNSQIKDIMNQKRDNPIMSISLFLYPISKIKLYGEFKDGFPTGKGYIRYVRLFFGIAVVVLAIACINFINLSTARSQKRAKEVGVRKTLGAKRVRLIQQFMSESGIITFASLILAVVLILLILPSFNQLVDKNLMLNPENLFHWLGLMCVGLLCTVLAGSYPAFFLSSFPPMDVLHKLKSRSGTSIVRTRQGLVIFQFAVSLTLIICVSFIYLQVDHTRNRSLGMNVEQVIVSDANQDIQNNFEPLKQDLIATGFVENVGISSQTMLDLSQNNLGWGWQGKPDETEPVIYSVSITDELLQTLDITLYDGRNYDRNIDANTNNIVINKAFADIMGEEGRIGNRVWRGYNSENALTIIGIVNNFISNDIYAVTQAPVAFHLDENGSNRKLFIRLKPGNIQNALPTVEAAVRKIAPNHPFEYQFMDEMFGQKFKSTLLVGKLAGWFAALAVCISCLGMFGLAAFAAEQRTREIGIRKVLGATIANVVIMLGHSFIVLIGISFVIAIPLAWWVMYGWLQSYEYRIGLSWWVFAAAGLLVVIIALLTVGFQAIKAATVNPVKAIKNE